MALDGGSFFVLTGGPGSGKSTLLSALAARGHGVAPEAGRAIIRQQQAIDGPALPWRDRAAFAEAMLAFDMRSHEERRAQPGPVFFDRGVPDVLGYLCLCDLPVPPHLARAAILYRYAPLVFVAPPWREIYANDAERRQDWLEAERTHAAMVETYGRLGYTLAELPRAGVAERVTFVLARVGAA
jgi:predicted ATPase